MIEEGHLVFYPLLCLEEIYIRRLSHLAFRLSGGRREIREHN